MNNRAGIWALGLAGSIVAHGGVLVLVSTAIRPQPLDEQVMPTSELEVQAYQLDRVAARQQQPENQKTMTGQTAGAQLAPGAIAHSRANARAPDADVLTGVNPVVETIGADGADAVPVRPVSQSALNVAARVPDAPTLTAALQVPSPATESRPIADNLTTVVAPDTAPLVAMVPDDVSVAHMRPETAVVAAVQPTIATVIPRVPVTAAISAVLRANPVLTAARPVPQAAVLAAVSRPVDTLHTATPVLATIVQMASSGTVLTAAVTLPEPAISAARPAVATLPQATPNLQQTPSQPVEAPQVGSTRPNAQRLKAALAFSGGDGDVDPVSVAAFQSFMQPGDIAASGDTLRDGVAGLLAQVPCSRLQVGFDPDTATLQVNGHIPEGDLRAPVLAALRAQMGADIAVSDNILILPRPQCGALAGIAGVGLAQSTDQNTNPLVIGQDAHVKVLDFVRNERLFFDITAPDYAAYVYVDYFDAGGNVLHLAPNDQVPLVRASAESALRIGAKAAHDPGLQILIGPPYGQEIAVAFAASAPLYDGLRPIQEPAAEYLEWLKARVEDARAKHADFKGEWVYFFVTTAEQ